MARPREFDERVAVERAMEAFWANGYEATSTQQLCEATGLGRSSIYNTFTSKHELFRATLRHYDRTTTDMRGRILGTAEPIRDRLRTLLTAMIDDEFANDRRGCLAVNSLIEIGKRDEEVATQLREDLSRFVADLAEAIARAQRDGEIDKDKDPLALARFVHSTVGGIRMTIRLGVDRRTVTDIVEVALAAL
ncbi:TetR/AcrR family transcriptional regulator [Saccharomonospora sp. NPDC006951]